MVFPNQEKRCSIDKAVLKDLQELGGKGWMMEDKKG